MLPYKTVKTFPNLFYGLEKSMEKLGIQTIGVSNTSMEEAFMW